MERRKRTPLELRVDRELIEKGKDALRDFDESQEMYIPAKRGDSRPISIRLPNVMLQRLRDLAVQKNVGYQQLIKVYLVQGLRREEKYSIGEHCPTYFISLSFPSQEEALTQDNTYFGGIEQRTFRTSGTEWSVSDSQREGGHRDGS